jgi:hypothetical protein
MNLNCLELVFNKAEIEILSTPYEKEKFDSLSLNHPEICLYRDGNTIYCWALGTNDNDFESVFSKMANVKICFENNSLIFCSIVENAIATYFKKNRNRPVVKTKYSSIWEVELTERKSFNGLDSISVLNFGIQPFYSIKHKKSFCILSIRITQKYNFTISDKEFADRNIDVRGWKRNLENEIVGSKDNVTNFIKVTNQKSNFDSYLNSFNLDSTSYEKLVKFVGFFNKTIIKDLILPDGLKISEFKLNLLPNQYLEASEIAKPRYYFHNNTPHTGGYYQEGIKNLKPATFSFFNNKLLKITIITPSLFEGTVEIFTQKILKELKETYHLTKLVTDIKTFDINILSYTDFINTIDFSGVNLVIVVVSQNDKSLGITSSAPYYATKAKLLNQRIPTQKVTIESIRKNDRNIESAISLNIYSKIGGTAWTIEKVEKDKIEVIIGISSTIDFEKNRLIGFASVFDFDGSYLIGACSPLSTKENYQINLQQYLISTIGDLIKEKAINKGESFRLIFHLSKEAGKKNEIRAIENALGQFKDYDIQFGIVHLSFNHNYRVFDNEGNTEIKRGTFIQISTFQALLHLGAKTKVPILVRLDKRSTFKDIYEITRQVFYFTHLCYRNLRPANVPVTIKYPSLMAKLTSDIKQVPNWDYAQLNHIKDKLWFI